MLSYHRLLSNLNIGCFVDCDLDLMHYAVSKALEEVREHKDQIKRLRTLIQSMIDTATIDKDIFELELQAINLHFKHKG